MAFFRYFPGHHSLEDGFHREGKDTPLTPSSDLVQSETRSFSRLTPLATWRSEYLFRTTLMSSLARGKPGRTKTDVDSPRPSYVDKKSSAVLTYNSRLPWAVTNIDVVFENGSKPPRAMHGTSTFGVATMSDPTTGKVSKWGFEDAHLSLDARDPESPLNFYGLSLGPAATENVMDLSQIFGVVTGEAIPGGRAYYRAPSDTVRRSLESHGGVPAAEETIPRVPSVLEGICSVWITKSAAVPTISKAMVGMLTGSTLGIVTAYSLNTDPKLRQGGIAARWAVSPGVPIIALKVDENYSVKRKTACRIWAVALNALGEVYYLDKLPAAVQAPASSSIAAVDAWNVGYASGWTLLENTKRLPNIDENGKVLADSAEAVQAAYLLATKPAMSRDERIANATATSVMLRREPAYFRQHCQRWDMRRRLEVDFAADDGQGSGEAIFVIDCGHAATAAITRFVRQQVLQTPAPAIVETPPAQQSIFGVTAEDRKASSPPEVPNTAHSREWLCQTFDLKDQQSTKLSASALDNSTPSLLIMNEDPLCVTEEAEEDADEVLPKQIPGGRTRYLVIGTDNGAVLVWNSRARQSTDAIEPIRAIKTTSPMVRCVAASSLYVLHGGSDGLVQAWDPLASTLEAVRTLNSKSNGQLNRRLRSHPAWDASVDCGAQVNAIYMDPDATNLRGVVAFGWSLKCWSYSAQNPNKRGKRRNKHVDAHACLASRRQATHFSGFIAEEEKEMARSSAERRRELSRLKARFGVGAFGDLSDREAIEYAQILSSEAFLADEQRRASDSGGDTSLEIDSVSSVSDMTPEPSILDHRSSESILTSHEEDEYDEELQRALRLSLMESTANDVPSSPIGDRSPDDFEFMVKYKPKGGRKSKGPRSTPQSPSGRIETPNVGGSSSAGGVASPSQDMDLALAMSLSMQDQEHQLDFAPSSYEEFPALSPGGAGKGKAPMRR